MDFIALLPLRSLGFLFLLLGLGPPGYLYMLSRGGAYPDSQPLSVFLSLLGICLLWIRPAVFQPKGRYRIFLKTMAIVRSVLICSYLAFVWSGVFLGTGIGNRLNFAMNQSDAGAWWTTLLTMLLVVLIIDLGLGVVQLVIPKLGGQ
ncbi:MAG: hypothetical protein F6K00_24350 [Leptolyngbya sp. SIOISBB]|nr:hypothetical protein [Leptolyngbya sp. SIOISBB]